jgi:hypothetical protein
MKTWRQALRDGVVSGGIAAAVSAVALAVAGQRHNGSPFAPVNAISHWIWGDEAAAHDGPSMRYSLHGYAIHQGASTMWASLYEKWLGDAAEKGQVAIPLCGGLAVSALACLVDYRLTPHRLQPGYEMRLPKKSLALVYAAFGVGLALRGLVMQRRRAPA